MARVNLLKACILLNYLSIAIGATLHQKTVSHALNELVELINSTQSAEGIKILVPSVIRLVFHDCVDGCDACFNPDLPANRNLNNPADALEPLYQSYKTRMSRADFWVLASKAAFNVGVAINNHRCNTKDCKTPDIDIRFRFGRTDCSTSPYHNNNTFFPSPLANSSVIFPWFKKLFNFNPNNVVAIMGMHTLGKAGHPFNGTWELGNPDGISNSYYKHIADPNHCWVQEYVSPQLSGSSHKIVFWRTEKFKGFALPVDMSLYKALQVNQTTGESSCTYHDCKRARTMGMFNRYASSTSNWARHIRSLFPRIIEKTNQKLGWPSRAKLCLEL
uniref:Ascorbate peroxidase n=2 Tax=Lepeophtheirus salmonis TaxID=72036 RepID=D3PHA8_LEPSM|nr:ascorbate peroxidase [Lepeophtheirus salmonis]